MRKQILFFMLVLISVLTLFGCENETAKHLTVAEARNLRDGTYVILTGTIVSANSMHPGNEWFIFRDDTGEILVEIENEEWARAGINWTELSFPASTFEIMGEVDKERNRANMIDVERIRRL